MATVEIKTLCLVRVPPGDRWREPEGSQVFSSLTSALEHIFQKTGIKEYRFSAAEGMIYTISVEEETPQPPKRYSLYGDE